MDESPTLTALKTRRLERMRQGQQAATIEIIPSDPEMRVALVPLLEGEYEECMAAAARIEAPDNLQGAQILDREERRQVVSRAAREVEDYSQRVFSSVKQMAETIEPTDINHLYDCYLEMVRQFSPKMSELSAEEIDFLSDLFGNLQWNGLSGDQVYALSRFLSLLQPAQLTGNLPGRLSTR